MSQAAWIVGILAIAGIAVAGTESTADASAGFEVYHWRSDPVDTLFNETFVVVRVDIGADVDDLLVWRGGQPQSVTWSQSGRLSVGDSFWFSMEAFDVQEVLEASWRGQTVMQCRFGGAAAVNIHPDEWAAIGQPDQVRCLDASDDT